MTLPSSLRTHARAVRLAGAPALLVHPDWQRPAPLVLWMHGRTADKELDPGRYLRWMRAGIAACAVDLPGHGERATPDGHNPRASLRVLAQAVDEIDPILAAIHDAHPGLFDPARLGLGGMSLGGMAALRRLCDPHPFAAAAVESTTGWLTELNHPTLGPTDLDTVAHARAAIEPLDPMLHADAFKPIPLLALHSVADQMVPWAGQRAFLDRLRQRYQDAGADPALIEVCTWTTTGAPREHIGFGKVAAEAKDLQTEFFRRILGPGPPGA